MKRAMAAVLAFCVAAPGPSFAGASIKTAAPMTAAVPALRLPSSALRYDLVNPALTPRVVLAQKALALTADDAVPASARLAAERASEGVQDADAAGRVLDAAFDGSLTNSRASEPTPASPALDAAPLLAPSPFRRATAAGFAGMFVPALLGAQQSSGSGGSGWTIPLVVAAAIAVILAARSFMKGPKKPAGESLGRRASDESRYSRPSDEPSASEVRPAPAPAAELVAPRDPSKVYFDDIAGQDDAKRELEEVVDYLKNPLAYKTLHPRYKGPKGVLVYGPPGTGKTMLARAVANEAGVPFVHRAGSDFINTYVGKGASNVRDAFTELRKEMKSKSVTVGILFIDEIEAIGGTRTGDSDRSEETRTINALLKEMDGFEKDNIIVIAATNMPESLDPALVRGGRFGTKVPVGLPDVVGRESVLKIHIKGAALSPELDTLALARQTPGLAGADLEQIVMDATKLAKRRGSSTIDQQDFINAIDEFTTGKQRRMIMTEADKRVIAYHESGHAVVSHLLPDADPVRKVTIIPHGLNALGFMQAMPEEERVVYSREWLVDRIAVALGGRVAEKMMTGRVYSGAQNDFQQATRMAKMMVMQFGMSEEIGPVSYDVEGTRPVVGGPLSEATRAKIDAEVKLVMVLALERVNALLRQNKDVVEAMAAELMLKETLVSADMDRLMSGARR